ncbi:MAG: tetratricopeptide repeat protein [Firmicutes bacterium]|nr:tetratricopeptide repeat protein [Bacillota bacterium]
MKRKVLVNFCLIFFVSLTFLGLAQDSLPEIIKKIEPSIIVVLTYDQEGKLLGQGSGFFINEDGEAITNRHVLEGAVRAEVKTIDGRIYSVTKIIAEDQEADIIKIKPIIPKSQLNFLNINPSLPKVGERIIVIGSPLGLEQTVSDGIVSAIRKIPIFGTIIQISAPISPGSSGSPVVNLEGEVIGVATFQMVEGQNLNFAIPGSRILELKSDTPQSLSEWGNIQLKPNLPPARQYYSAGVSLMLTKKYSKAISSFKQAIDEDPEFAEAYFHIGYCHDELGEHQAAVTAFKKAIELKPTFVEAYYNLGIAFNELGQFEEAIEAYRKAAQLKPDFFEAFFNLGVALGKVNDHQEAVNAFKQAIKISPDDAESHLNLGIAYGHLGMYQEALEALKQAIRINPDDPMAHYSIGIVYLSLDDRNSALQEYKILKELDPEKANRLFDLIYK